MASSLATKLFGFLVFFLSVTAAYFAVNAIKQTQFPTTAVTVQPATPSPPVNPFAQAHGRHLVAYLFTASDCGWSNEPTLMKHLGQIRTLLRSVHHGRFAAITVVGVSLDTDVQVGMDFLSKIAGGTIAETFDEVSIGGSWLNENAVRRIWQSHALTAASPQVLLVERQVDTSAYMEDATIGVSDDRILASLSGARDLTAWLQNGVPLAESAALPATRRD